MQGDADLSLIKRNAAMSSACPELSCCVLAVHEVHASRGRQFLSLRSPPLLLVILGPKRIIREKIYFLLLCSKATSSLYYIVPDTTSVQVLSLHFQVIFHKMVPWIQEERHLCSRPSKIIHSH